MALTMINTLSIIAGYLIGSISSSILIAQVMSLPDPRSFGSGNPGATNMLRTGSKKAAAITLLCDLLKGLIPLLVARGFNVDTHILCLIGLAAILGHMYPVYYRFAGGKGVATTLGVLIGIHWQLALLWVALWLITAKLSGYSSLAALVATALLPVSSYVLKLPNIVTITCIIIAVFVIWRHRSNINNLLTGKESKIKNKG